MTSATAIQLSSHILRPLQRSTGSTRLRAILTNNMGRGMAILGPVMATAFGVATAYTTFQPELVKDRAEREGNTGDFSKEHQQHEEQAEQAEKDTIISRQMASDFREAGQQIKSEGGFAWGIRQAIFGTGKDKKDEVKEQGSG